LQKMKRLKLFGGWDGRFRTKANCHTTRSILRLVVALSSPFRAKTALLQTKFNVPVGFSPEIIKAKPSIKKIPMNSIRACWNRLPVIGLSLYLLNLTVAHPVMAQEQGQTQRQILRSLSVTGRGEETIPATIALVQLGVEVQGKNAAQVQQEVAQRSSAVVELLRSRNVEKLQTTGIRLNPNYSYQNNVQRLTGYTAVNTVSFRIDTQRVGNLLDEAVNAGATRIDGISFVASEEAIATARQQALREATLDAQRQADVVLSTLNLSRQEVIGIQINNAFAPPPPAPVAEFRAANMGVPASTPVIGGEQRVEAVVTLQIRY
jgi:uncharacterized protein